MLDFSFLEARHESTRFRETEAPIRRLETNYQPANNTYLVKTFLSKTSHVLLVLIHGSVEDPLVFYLRL